MSSTQTCRSTALLSNALEITALRERSARTGTTVSPRPCAAVRRLATTVAAITQSVIETHDESDVRVSNNKVTAAP